MLLYKAREFRGAKSPEQRSSAAASADPIQLSVSTTEKGGMLVKTEHDTAVLRLKINWPHICLVLLHLVVLIFSALSQEFITAEAAARALP